MEPRELESSPKEEEEDEEKKKRVLILSVSGSDAGGVLGGGRCGGSRLAHRRLQGGRRKDRGLVQDGVELAARALQGQDEGGAGLEGQVRQVLQIPQVVPDQHDLLEREPVGDLREEELEAVHQQARFMEDDPYVLPPHRLVPLRQHPDAFAHVLVGLPHRFLPSNH